MTPARTGAQDLAAQLDSIRGTLRAIAWEQAERSSMSLTAPQLQTLKVLVSALRAGEASLSLSELSARLGLAHSTVSGIVDRLTQRGLLQRHARSGDRRFVEIGLDAQAQAWVTDELPDLRIERLQSALARTTPARRAAILRSVRELAALLADSEAPSPARPAPERVRARPVRRPSA